MVAFDGLRKLLARTCLERCLLVAVSLLSAAVITLVVVVAVSPKYAKDSVCRSSSCQALGSAISESIDYGLDPCEDFYGYVCGGWEKKRQIPDDLGQYGVTEILRDDVLVKIRDLLSPLNHTESLAVENAKKFYNSCVDKDAIERRGVEPLLKLLKEFGGWPVVDSTWSRYNYDPLEAIARIQLRTSFGFIIFVVISADYSNTSRNILQLDKPSLILHPSVLLDQDRESSREELRHFKEFYFNIAKLMVPDEKSDLEAHFQDIVDVEAAMYNMMTLNDKESDSQRMTLNELNQIVPQIDWLWFLQELTNSTLKTLGKDAVLAGNDMVVVQDIQYIRKMSEFVTDRDRFRQIANYLGWRVILTRFAHLPNAFQEALLQYSNDTGYTQQLPERWKMCVKATSNAFSVAVSFLYVQKYFPEDVRNEVMKLVLDLRFQFEKSLLMNDWMDSATRRAALTKLNFMKINMGYPEWMIDEDALNERYKETNSPEMTDDIFQNDLATTLQTTRAAILKLRQSNVKQTWPLAPIVVNAGYNRNLNAITFPAAFLQEPLYSAYVPRFYNYATIGAVIGHEITHGFDNEGRRRNATGEMNNWWSKDSEKEFLHRAECFINQYNDYGLNGKLTLSENIADNGGLRQAYLEFCRWKSKQEDVRSLPGLEHFTVQQQFFLSYGSIWCTKYRPEVWNSTVTYSEHAPAPYRLKGTLWNLPEFYDAFKCPKNLARKVCAIW